MNVNRVVSKGLCTGCGICASVFPSKIKINFSGDYNRPISNYDLTPQENSVFTYICPGVNQSSPSKKYNHVIWGKYERSYIGYSSDRNTRFIASSGGVISQTIIYLLNEGLIDAVVQVRSSKSNPLENEVVVNYTENDVLESSGSRYSPASPLQNIKQVIDANPNIRLCFVGKPCDITALTNLMNIDEAVRASIKYKVSFFCAGTPSRKGVGKLMVALGVNELDVECFSFRGKGWPGKAIVKTDKKIAEMSYSESWGSILGPTIQNRCKICADGIGENADVVSADVWHSDDSGYPLFTESDGQGLILTRTEKGNALIDQMIAGGVLDVSDYDLEGLKGVQPTQYERKGSILARGFAKFIMQGVFPKYRNQRLLRAAMKIGFRKNIRAFLGALIRAKKGEI